MTEIFIEKVKVVELTFEDGVELGGEFHYTIVEAGAAVRKWEKYGIKEE